MELINKQPIIVEHDIKRSETHLLNNPKKKNLYSDIYSCVNVDNFCHVGESVVSVFSCYIVCVLFNEKKLIFLYNLQYPHTLLEAGCCQTRHQRHPQDMNEETGDSHESGRPSLSCSVLLHHLWYSETRRTSSLKERKK